MNKFQLVWLSKYSILFVATSSLFYTASLYAIENIKELSLDNMCVTNGKIDEGYNIYGKILKVKSYGMRAVSNYKSDYVGVKFRYLGNSEIDKPLASGEMRRQIALKLNAKDTCNLIYVAWHIEPSNKIAVSVKLNPNMSTHKECKDNGYYNLKNQISMPINKIQIGEWHTLEAKITQNLLHVYADRKLVWSNTLPQQALDLEGTNGIRTDNASFDIHFYQNININENNKINPICKTD